MPDEASMSWSGSPPTQLPGKSMRPLLTVWKLLNGHKTQWSQASTQEGFNIGDSRAQAPSHP